MDLVPGSHLFERTRDRLSKAGIRWIFMRYHKQTWMFAKCFDVFVGTLTAMFIAIKCRFSAVHCPSYVAALTGWILKRILGVRFLFDIEGFGQTSE